MEKVFISLLNTSITAGYLVIAVMLLRPLLRKAPKYIRCILWSLVGLRLILPFSFESKLSVVPSAQPVPPEIISSPAPVINTGISYFNSAVNPVISETMKPIPETTVTPMQTFTDIAWNIWLVGMAAMVIYSIVSFIILKRKLREAVREDGNIYLCDRVRSPFLLGLFFPKIYLPSSLSEDDKVYVLAHENAHIRRKDHWWKPLGFLLLTIYWFNPLMWVAYIFLCRDIEFACDEKVLRQLGTDCKKPYSEALINCSIPKKMISACPIAFGEDSVKGRIKSVLNYKKPAFWIILVALITCVVVAVCFLTNPPDKDASDEPTVEESDAPVGTPVETPSHTEYKFTARVVEVNFENDSIIVEYQPPLTYSHSKPTPVQYKVNSCPPQIAVGQDVIITYDGNVMETNTHPRTLGKIYNIEIKNADFTPDYTFNATIIAISPDSVTVKPFLNEDELSSIGEEIVLRLSEEQLQGLQVGESIQVTYDGQINELYPPILPNVSTIRKLNTQEGTTGPDQFYYSVNALAQATFDIDEDGILENCVITHGPTSGIFSFIFTAYQNNVPEYCNVFCGPFFLLSFRTLDTGKTVLVAQLQGENPTEKIYDISIKNGNISLSNSDETMWYWGNPVYATPTALSEIRKNYPQYLNLDTSNGLEVYVWNRGVWLCGVRSRTNQNATREELSAFGGGLTLDTMALILSTYDITRESVTIFYNYHPASSGEYPNTPSEENQTYIEGTLFAYLPQRLNAPYIAPEYNVQTDYDLVICGYKLSKNSWRFKFYENSTIPDSVFDARTGLNGLSPEEARKKLAEYDLLPESIPVIPVSSYVSSYYYEINQQTTAEARAVLGLT